MIFDRKLILKLIYIRLWSDSGLRSLAKDDNMFHKNNNYWCGPVWINMNYLVLKGLKG